MSRSQYLQLVCILHMVLSRAGPCSNLEACEHVSWVGPLKFEVVLMPAGSDLWSPL